MTINDLMNQLKAKIEELQNEVKDWERSFKLYNDASTELMNLYKEEHLCDYIMPDVGKVNRWAVNRIKELKK